MCISSSDTSIEPRAVAVSYWLLAVGAWHRLSGDGGAQTTDQLTTYSHATLLN